MTPLPTIPDCFRVAFTWNDPAFARPAVNVMHFLQPTGFEAELSTKLEAHVTASMWNHARTSSSIVSYAITSLASPLASVVFATNSAAKWSGTVGSGDALAQVTPIVKCLTIGRGRSYRGRIYLPWPVEAAVATGTLVDSYRTSMQSAWSAFLTAMTGAGATPAVASYKLSTANEITSYTVEHLLGTQRLRQPR